MKTILLFVVLLMTLSLHAQTALCGTHSPWADASITSYHLPAWITALNWVQPAMVIYGGTAAKPEATPDLSQYFVNTNTRAGDTTKYCQWVRVEGGIPPYTYSVQGAPPGLHIATVGNDAIYGGRATVPGKYMVTLCATDATGLAICLPPHEHRICDGGKTVCLF